MFAIKKENGFFDVRRWDTFEAAVENLRADGDVVVECEAPGRAEDDMDPDIWLHRQTIRAMEGCLG